MRHALLVLLFATFFGAGANAQAGRGTPLLTDDLCACMGHIDMGSDDRKFEGAVRGCLEEAVVRHPAEVRGLLHRYPAQGNKPYLLGLLLGGALEGSCERYAAVKARLQQIVPQVAAKRTGS